MNSSWDAYLSHLNKQKAALDQLRPFPLAALKRLHEQMVIEWTYNSNAIEGNTLTLKETALVLQQGITIAGKPLREHLEAVNHREAIQKLEEIVQKKSSLSEESVRSLHRIILKGIDDAEAGRWRRERVRILGAVHLPPDPIKVPRLMAEFTDWLVKEEPKAHPVWFAGMAHYRFVHIHPFIDGNGRCARLLMNLVLMRGGFPPAVILKVDRPKYYRFLQQADQNEYDNYLRFIARSVERSLALYLHTLAPSTSKTYQKQGFVSLAEAARGTPYTQEYLSLLARKGVLHAVKFQRNWLTTHDAVREYMVEHGVK